MKEYIDLVKNVLENGEEREDRTGVGTISLFGTQTRYDLRKGFPLLTTKQINFDNVVYELLWFLSGSTNIKDLKAPKLWDSWADKSSGELGPIYGKQWREWEYTREDQYYYGESWCDCTCGGCYGTYHNSCSHEIDQIANVIESIKEDPYSRRHIVSAWNVAKIEEMALPPCHVLFQFYVTKSGELDLHLFQRSGDIALGVPYNISSYSLLLTLISKETNLTPRFFIHSIGDAHIYLNHVEKLKEQIEREPRNLPLLFINQKKNLERLVADQDIGDFRLVGYFPHAFIKYKVAV